MIDPIGVKPGTLPGTRFEPASQTKIVSIDAARAPRQVVAETGAREASKAMAAKPPVDAERVQQIKRALAEGRYPIVPATIVDRLIAAQLQWVEPK